MSSTTTPVTVAQASKHLWEALSRHKVTMDLGAHDPLVRAISAYGQACRTQDDDSIASTSKHVWEELSHHQITMDFAANDPVVRALAEYGDACRHEGPAASK